MLDPAGYGPVTIAKASRAGLSKRQSPP